MSDVLKRVLIVTSGDEIKTKQVSELKNILPKIEDYSWSITSIDNETEISKYSIDSIYYLYDLFIFDAELDFTTKLTINLKEYKSDSRIICLGNDGDSSKIAKIIIAGATDYITYPYEESDVIDTIKKVLVDDLLYDTEVNRYI